MKIITVSTLLLLSLMFNVVNAKDALIKEPVPIQQPVQMDPHITWLDFRNRLANYTRVNAGMTDGGVITLRGFVGGPFDSDRLEELASRVEGATKVENNTGMK